MVDRETNKERVSRYRQRKIDAGGRQLSLMLEPETARMLDSLRRHFGRSRRGKNAPLLKRAIETLYKMTIE